MEDQTMDNSKKVKEERPLSVPGVIGMICFFLGLLPWIFIACGAFFGVPKGLFSVDNVYGFDAVIDVLRWNAAIPVIPVCVLYQIIFAVAYIRKSTKKVKIAALAVTGAVLVSVLVPCFIFEKKKADLIKESSPAIEAHLASRYGEEFAHSVKIKVSDYDDRYFDLINPATDKPASIHYSITEPDKLYDLVMNGINNDEVNKRFSEFAAKKLGLPENIEIDTKMETADLTGFKAGDDPAVLFESAEFKIKSITIHKDKCEANEVLPEVQRLWKNVVPLIGDHYYSNSFTVKITSGSEVFATAQIDYPANYNGMRPVGSIHTPYTGAYYLD